MIKLTGQMLEIFHEFDAQYFKKPKSIKMKPENNPHAKEETSHFRHPFPKFTSKMTSIFYRNSVFPSEVLHARPSQPNLKGQRLYSSPTIDDAEFQLNSSQHQLPPHARRELGKPETEIEGKKIQIRFDNCPGAAGAFRVAVNCKLIRVPIFQKIFSDKRNFSSLLIVSSYKVSQLQAVICLILFFFPTLFSHSSESCSLHLVLPIVFAVL